MWCLQARALPRGRPGGELSVPGASVRGVAKAAAAIFECSECGWRAAKWAGRCGECQTWGSVAQAPASLAGGTVGSGPAARRVPLLAGTPRLAAVPISRIDAAAAKARPTGMAELDRVLGGGLVP